MFRLLLIEDSFDTRENLKELFETKTKYLIELVIACDGPDGLDKVRKEEFDLVLFDIKPRGGMYIDLCRRIRERCRCPIVFITTLENDDELDMVYAIGADDFIIKPYTSPEIIFTVLEYMKKSYTCPVIECGGIRLNAVTGLVIVDGRVVEVPDKPTEILRLLMKNKPETVERDIILKEVWGKDYSGDDRVIDKQINILRQALGKKGNLIQTVKGTGYRIRGHEHGIKQDSKAFDGDQERS